MQYTGKAEVRIGGVLYESMDGAKLTNPMAESRKGVKGAYAYGWVRDAEIPTIDFDIPMNDTLKLADIWAYTDQVATFECDDGTIFTLADATVGKADITTGGDVAKYSVQIIGTQPATQS
jgi:hypothetical protein